MTGSVVFTGWTKMLDLVAEGLSTKGIMFRRLDGSKSLTQRRQALRDFRHLSDCQVLLASLGAAANG